MIKILRQHFYDVLTVVRKISVQNTRSIKSQLFYTMENTNETKVSPLVPFTLAIMAGIIAIYLFSREHTNTIPVALVIAGGAFAVGGLLGFLFGIPRTLQSQGNGNGANTGSDGKPQYLVNTNLEQISDWLTKIIVGVGLVQIASFPAYFESLGDAMMPALGNADNSKVFGLALVVYFVVLGFMYGYIATRTELVKAFRDADSLKIKEKVENLEIDNQAVSMVNKHLLSSAIGSDEVNITEMTELIMKCTQTAKVSIFYLAQKVRGENWRTNKHVMERTIPVFQALVRSDPEKKYHQNFSQLGYALKDKETPDYQSALTNLTRAIEIRGAWQEHGWRIYEMNRAYCRIQLDLNFQSKKASDETVKKLIDEDLRAAESDTFLKKIVLSDEVFVNWRLYQAVPVTV
jgi:hypothetical protein